MHRRPRTPSLLQRLILAWIVLALGVAVTAPMAHTTSMTQVCAADGSTQWVAVDADGQAGGMSAHMPECPLCLAAGVPTLPPTQVRSAPRPPLEVAPHSTTPAHAGAPSGAPLPARGPPRFS